MYASRFRFRNTKTKKKKREFSIPDSKLCHKQSKFAFEAKVSYSSTMFNEHNQKGCVQRKELQLFKF